MCTVFFTVSLKKKSIPRNVPTPQSESYLVGVVNGPFSRQSHGRRLAWSPGDVYIPCLSCLRVTDVHYAGACPARLFRWISSTVAVWTRSFGHSYQRRDCKRFRSSIRLSKRHEQRIRCAAVLQVFPLTLIQAPVNLIHPPFKSIQLPVILIGKALYLIQTPAIEFNPSIVSFNNNRISWQPKFF